MATSQVEAPAAKAAYPNTTLGENRLDTTKRAFGWADLVVLGLLIAVIYAVVRVAREWGGQLQSVAEIHLEARYLPLYGLFSLTRGVIAYGISFLFTMVYGYMM